jgi:hypothetical protein
MASQIEKDNPRNRLLLDLYRKGRRFPFYNLNIDKKRKLTLENITAFDQNGEYVDDLMGYIYNMNIIKQLYTSDPSRVVQYIQIVYHDWSEDNYANITLPDNDDFIKNYLCMFTEFEELDKHFEEFVSEYDLLYIFTNNFVNGESKYCLYLYSINGIKIKELSSKNEYINFFINNDRINAFCKDGNIYEYSCSNLKERDSIIGKDDLDDIKSKGEILYCLECSESKNIYIIFNKNLKVINTNKEM